MSNYVWYAVAGILVFAWIAALYYATHKWSGAKKLEARGFSMYGPFVMWRTMRGRGLIEKISTRRRLWGAYGDLAIVLCGLAAIVMMGLLVFTATQVPSIGSENAPDPENMLGIPGINQYIPLWYGIFALAIALIVHEGAHGVLMRAGDIKLKSLGLLFLIFPMGAFAEQDDQDMINAPRRKRMRAYAVGPAANLIVAFVCMLVFTMVMMPAVSVAQNGVGLVEVPEDGPAYGILRPGMIMTSFNGTEIAARDDFVGAIANASAGQSVEVGAYYQGSYDTYTVVLGDKANYTDEASDAGMGYLGVVSTTVSTGAFHPVGDARTPTALLRNSLTFISLPLIGLSPIQGPQADFYEISGPLDAGTFWLLANAIYWVFWLNLMVGLTNVLPAYPLDGGFIFKDWLEKLYAKLGLFGGLKERQVRAAEKLVVAMSFAVLFLILWQMIGPRIM
jgi:membrane-associated protease RseP (regulator of RpoE activity)